MENQSAPKKDNFLAVSILVAAFMISASLIYVVRGGGAVPNDRNLPAAVAQPSEGGDGNVEGLLASSPRDVILGDPAAPVTIIEYGDYQCPFCGRFFSETEPLIKKNYVETGKAKMIYRNLAFLGPESVAAAEAAECAKDQGKFWAYHDALFATEIKDGEEHNGNLNRDLFVKLAKGVGMNVNDFASCVDAKKYANEVREETSAAQAVGVNGTPTTFVNGKRVQGAQPYSSFEVILDSFLTAR